eukprot:CAMPEP_0176346866 /NCGR_PEP_ID=MMETSP0126-20121128/6571_1 /TAXON_ID=141414 ORGANISM="Strombidinopsis acuminatum, Strain SPMC142" /NCGR_SAMPLE_ID=MMETSP0126 /ASSEMBLY_ACC=CAM_ASM_000229 /LENGTH=84 /DNA_ID=CAMNT_0017694641 /DNA_START=71 /DNA_END=325 /DNA_ORIENTATION=+
MTKNTKGSKVTSTDNAVVYCLEKLIVEFLCIEEMSFVPKDEKYLKMINDVQILYSQLLEGSTYVYDYIEELDMMRMMRESMTVR